MIAAIQNPIRHFFEVPMQNQRRWTTLIPIIGTIALGAILSPQAFLPGIAVGLGVLLLTSLIGNILERLKPLPGDSEYENQISTDQPFETAVAQPIGEELVFRGAIQMGIRFAMQRFLPAVTISLFGPQIALATLVSISVSSILFGIIHLFNDHPGRYRQGALCTFSGFAWGILGHNLGILAPIGGHIVNNSLLVFDLFAAGKLKKPTNPQLIIA